jgi:hypothetical protein
MWERALEKEEEGGRAGRGEGDRTLIRSREKGG